MNEEISRIKRDLQIIETALGLNVWTWRDVRRGFLGDLGAGAAGLFLALWMFYGGVPMVGLLVYFAYRKVGAAPVGSAHRALRHSQGNGGHLP